jgi:uncharacterized membrane protein
MNKLMTILVATLALALVAFTPDLASAGHGHGGGGWHGGGHWHRGGGHWRGGRGWHGGWGGYRGWGYRRYGWGGWGGTSMWVATAAAAGRRATAIIPAATAGGIRD